MIKKKNGTNGSIWFVEEYEKIIKIFPLLKSGETPNKMKIEDAIKLTKIAIDSEHYMFEELERYSEEVRYRNGTKIMRNVRNISKKESMIIFLNSSFLR